MFNECIFIGNLTKDVEVRYTPGGTPVGTINLAVNSKYKSGDETKEDVLYLTCIVFGKRAETCGQYLSKGKKALVTGRLRERKWEHEGKQHSKFELIVNDVKFLSPKSEQRPATENQGDAPGSDETTDLEPF